MPKNLTESSTFPSIVTVPVDADPADAASVEVPFQALADRTRFLRDYCTDQGVQLPAALLWGRYLHAASIVVNDPAVWARSQNRIVGSSDFTAGYFDLTPLLPRNASIARLRALVDPGVARAGESNRMRLRLLRTSYGISFGSPAESELEIAAARDDGTADLQWIEIDLVAGAGVEPVAGGATWIAEVRTGVDASMNADAIHALYVEFTAATIRNN